MNDQYKNSYKATAKELVSLSVYNVGYQLCDAGYQWGPGIRDHYLIHYVISGKGTYEVNAATILQATDFSRKHPCIHAVPNGEEVKRQLLHIYDARGNGFEHAVEMTGRLYTTLALFLKSSTQKETQLTAATYVQKSIEYISANYSYPITVEDIAAYVGLSRSHLFRSFELVLQQSPKEYLTDFRMKQACYLLEHSNLSITAIANSVGFDNGLYFSKTFHKKKGASPKAYRIKIRGTE